MRLLFDTHIFLWMVANNPKLSVRARRLIDSADEVFISSASIWEVAIKASKGKLDVDVDRLVDKLKMSQYRELPVRGGCQDFRVQGGLSNYTEGRTNRSA
ncbi:hypothetical protein BconGalA64_55500 [Burkholderia contaminans]|nr:hypothetical protein BconGalA64_55500 [Burkholderia contaminans]